MNRGNLVARLPLDEAIEGPVFDRQQDHDHNDRVFAAWEAPLVWHHQASYLAVDGKFNNRRALHFAFEDRVPDAVWSKGWHIWYDNAILLRQQPPADCVLDATIALEEQTAGFGGDNVDHVRPWSGLVARLQDLRRYYFLALEFPDAVVLYRREDKQWVKIAWRQVTIDVWIPYRLRLECRGDNFRAWLDDQFLFSAVDYAFETGWVGVRATCTSFVTDFTVTRLEGRIPSGAAPLEGRVLSRQLPTPEIVADFDLAGHGLLSTKGRKAPPGMTDERYLADLVVGDFLGDDRDLVVVKVNGSDFTHLCIDQTGKVIWRATLPGVEHWVKLPAQGRKGINLAGVGREELIIVDGRTGEVQRRAPAPRAPNGKAISAGNCPKATADFDGTGSPQCFFLSVGCDDNMVWAYDAELKLRWYAEAPSGGGHGFHISACDVDGDGYDEIFHGCALYDRNGVMRWKLDEVVRRLLCPNGGHVDASVMGFFDGSDAPPTVHLAASSAGHIVVDARTGEVLVAHPQGHVQTCSAGRVVPGESGTQVISTNRWGSYGVTAVYTGNGRRLARFQPGFSCHRVTPIHWDEGDLQHLLVVDGRGWRGIYDHKGCLKVDLDAFVPYDDPFRQRNDQVQAWLVRVAGQSGEGILMRCGSRLRVLKPGS